jgi:hypothetical protein
MAHRRLTDLLREAHGGEVLGAALFAELADTATVPDRRRKLTACRLLEEQTRATIVDLAVDLGVELDDAGDKADAGRAGAAAMATLPWPAVMAAVADGTGAYRSLYGRLVDEVPDPADPRVAEIVAHEQALNGFARAESEGDPNAIDRLLDALSLATRAQLTTAER